MVNRLFYIRQLSFFLMVFSVLFSHHAAAQENLVNSDTLYKNTFNKGVITANRYNSKIVNSGATVAILGSEENNTMPGFNFSNTSKLLPGIFVSSTDGMGLTPHLTLRGFRGSDEAEFITLLVDGIPLNDPESGLANFNLLPLISASIIELVRGGSSALYGDGAMAGVMNIITQKNEKKFLNVSLGFGSRNTANFGISLGAKLGKGFYKIYGNRDQTDGFRDHSKWKSTTFGGTVKYPLNRNSTFSLAMHSQLLDAQEPGSLNDSSSNEDRRQSAAYFREDGTKSQKHLVNIGINSKISKTTRIEADLIYQNKNSDRTRTFQQPSEMVIITETDTIFEQFYDTTFFGDTKLKHFKTDQISLNIRLFHQNPDNNAKISGGIETSYTDYNYSVYDVFAGFENDYKINFEKNKTLNASGTGFRFKSAVWLSSEILLLEPLSLIAALRYDILSDDFNGSKPQPDTTVSEINSSLNPKLALNLVTGQDEKSTGSIYFTYSQAFKSPTINQLADFSLINTNVFETIPNSGSFWKINKRPPLANSNLKPQKIYNWELGTYQHYRFSQLLSSEINLVGFYSEVKNEIVFDPSTFRYQNIGSSEHIGLEMSIKANYKNVWNTFFNLTYCEVKLTSGQNKDKFLKGIPNTSYLFGVSYSEPQGFGASLLMNGAGGIWLDDENTGKLKPFITLSTRISYKWRFATLYADIENIFDKKYYSTAYLMGGDKFIYPSAGRLLMAGMFINI